VIKPVRLVGESMSETIIDGRLVGNALAIMSDRVNVTGFCIQNGGSNTWPNVFGVGLTSRRHCTIEDCLIKNNEYAVGIYYAYNNTIRNNIVANSSSYSIFIYSADNNTVANNTVIDNHGTGIEIEQGSQYNLITKNNISSNHYEGIYVLGSDSNSITDNSLSSNGHGNPPLVYPGIKFMYSKNNTATGNTLFNNTGGIIVYSDRDSLPARYNIIENNTIRSNNYGIVLEYRGYQSQPSTPTFTSILGNILESNGYGLVLFGVDNNTIYHNNFLGSTVAQVMIVNSTNKWDNGFEGNYWSDFVTKYPNATEIDSTGIWNTPYTINASNIDHYPLVNQTIIAEFPSLFFVITSIIATLLLVTILKRKRIFPL
jgi:parallel beta-helix repeat protein